MAKDSPKAPPRVGYDEVNMLEYRAAFKLVEEKQPSGKPAAALKVKAWDKDNKPDTILGAVNFCRWEGVVTEVRTIDLGLQQGGHNSGAKKKSAKQLKENWVRYRGLQAKYVAQSKRKVPIPPSPDYRPPAGIFDKASAAPQGATDQEEDDPMEGVQQGPSNNASPKPAQKPDISAPARKSMRGKAGNEGVPLQVSDSSERVDDEDAENDGTKKKKNADKKKTHPGGPPNRATKSTQKEPGGRKRAEMQFRRNVQMVAESSGAAAANIPEDVLMICEQANRHEIAKQNNDRSGAPSPEPQPKKWDWRKHKGRFGHPRSRWD